MIPLARGGGGPYRAFIGREGLDMLDPQTAVLYRQLSPQEKEVLREEGLRMRDAARQRSEHHIPRASTRRQIEQSTRRELTQLALGMKTKEAVEHGEARPSLDLVQHRGIGGATDCLQAARRELTLSRRAGALAEQRIVDELRAFDGAHRGGAFALLGEAAGRDF